MRLFVFLGNLVDSCCASRRVHPRRHHMITSHRIATSIKHARPPSAPSEPHRPAAATEMAYRRKPQPEPSFEHRHPQPVSPSSPSQDSLAAQAMRASAAHRDASSLSSAYSSSAASAAAAARRSHEPSVSTPSPVSFANLLLNPSAVFASGCAGGSGPIGGSRVERFLGFVMGIGS